MKNENTYKSIWETLSKIDCSEHIEQIQYGNRKPLSYLSWAWAWGEVKNSYPDASYEVHDNVTYPDNTVEVRVSVTIKGQTHMMWLPVMDFKNDAKKNPTSKDISDSRMRCLAKAIAMHGLGHYVYAGEDVPEGNAETPQSEEKAEEVVDPIQKATPTPPPPTEATPDVVSAENGEVKKTEDWTMVTDAFHELINAHKSPDTLMKLWKNNAKARKLLKEKRPKMLENLRNIFYRMELSTKETRILSGVFASLGKKR